MRCAWILFVVGCAAQPKPVMALYVNGVAAVRPVVAAVGSRVGVTTDWAGECEIKKGIWFFAKADSSWERCHEVRHQTRVRCAEPCTITHDGRASERVAIGAWTRDDERYGIAPRGDTLAVTVSVDDGGGPHTVAFPSVRFAAPRELIVECGTSVRGFGSCGRELTATEGEWIVQVREASGISLPGARFNGVASESTSRSLLGVAPAAVAPPDRYNQRHAIPGDYPVTVEVGELRTIVVLRIR